MSKNIGKVFFNKPDHTLEVLWLTRKMGKLETNIGLRRRREMENMVMRRLRIF